MIWKKKEYGLGYLKLSGSHEALAAAIAKNKYPVASAIVTLDRLDSKLVKNPKYMKQEHWYAVCKLREEARNNLTNRYMDIEDARKLLKKRGMPAKKDNYSTGEDRFFSDAIDRVFEAQEFEKMFELLRDYEEAEGHKKSWPKKRLEMLLPRHGTTFTRVYDMPEPFDHWDDRNRIQQFYFVEMSPDIISWARGGSGGSASREDHGRLAHTFATLAVKYGIEAETAFFHYSSKNEFRKRKVSKKFVAYGHDLTGNYQADYKEAERLFKGRKYFGP